VTDMRTPETYRGIKVPEHLMNRATMAEWSMWKMAVVDVLDTVVPLLEPFVDEEPCRFDHHGYCQEHGSFGEGPCDIAAVKNFLAAANYDECVWVVSDLAPRNLYWCFQHRPRGIKTTRQQLVKVADLPAPGPYESRKCVGCGREIKVQTP
jgi:hypothetical protein